MEELLSQKNKHFENPKRQSPSKRDSLKKWFRRAVSKCDEDDSFYKEDTILIEKDDDLVFIPILSEVEDELCTTSRELPASLLEQSSRHRSHHHRQKIRDFKLLLKMKMHLFKSDEIENCEISNRTQSTIDQDNSNNDDDGNDCNGIPLDCYEIFNTRSEHLDALFDYVMKTSLKPTQSKELQPFQYLTYNDDNSMEPAAMSPLEYWDRDEEISPVRTDAERDITISNVARNDEDKDCCTLSTEKSFEQSPSLYSSSESNAEENSATSSDDLTSDSSRSTEQDTQNTLCSSEGSEISSGSASGDSNTVIYTIPTFKQKRGELNVSGIVRSFKEGTLTEKKLTHMAKRNSSGITFRNQKFYDEPSSSADEDDEDQSTQEHGDSNLLPENDELRIAPNNTGGVKFDNYSHILVYRTAKRNVGSRPFNCPTLRSLNFKSSPMQDKIEKPVCASKSILKKAENEREAEEIVKATHCDTVNVNSFLTCFEYFENQKHSEEGSLGKVRDQQLSHYYSKEFFPELLEGIKSSHSFNSEYRKSKLATEVNIGRKINDGVGGDISHLDNVAKVPETGSIGLK